jgi:hypothetical protein
MEDFLQLQKYIETAQLKEESMSFKKKIAVNFGGFLKSALLEINLNSALLQQNALSKLY